MGAWFSLKYTWQRSEGGLRKLHYPGQEHSQSGFQFKFIIDIWGMYLLNEEGCSISKREAIGFHSFPWKHMLNTFIRWRRFGTGNHSLRHQVYHITPLHSRSSNPIHHPSIHYLILYLLNYILLLIPSTLLFFFLTKQVVTLTGGFNSIPSASSTITLVHSLPSNIHRSLLAIAPALNIQSWGANTPHASRRCANGMT